MTARVTKVSAWVMQKYFIPVPIYLRASCLKRIHLHFKYLRLKSFIGLVVLKKLWCLNA